MIVHCGFIWITENNLTILSIDQTDSCRDLKSLVGKKKEVYSHVPEFRHRHSYLVSLLFAAPIPTLVIFLRFLPLVHALFLSKRHHEFTTPEIMHAHPDQATSSASNVTGIGLVDDHTLHQPCVQCLSFKSRL